MKHPYSKKGRGVEGFVKPQDRSQTHALVWAVLEMHRGYGKALEKTDIHQRDELCEALVATVGMVGPRDGGRDG